MKRSWKRPAMIAVGLAFSAAAVVFFLHRLRGNWDEVGRAFARADYLYVLPAVGFIALMYALRVVRWRVFLDPIQEVPYRDVATATCIGFMSSCILPLRAGEVIRPYVLHRKSGLGFGYAAGTAMGLERVFDLIGACFILFLALALLPASMAELAREGAGEPAGGAWLVERVHNKGLWFAGLTLAGMGALMVVAFWPSATLKVAEFFLGLLPGSLSLRLGRFVGSVVETLSFLRRPGRVGTALVLSLALWLCYPLSTYCLARGFNLQIPLAGVLWVQVLVTMAVVMPQAPGFIGVFQVAAMVGVELYGVPKGDAGAFATMMWALNVFPITIVGLAVLWYEGLSLRRLARASEAAAGSEVRPEQSG